MSDSFTCLTSGGPGWEKHLQRVWDGIAQRFGVKKGKGNITKTQRDGISAIRAIQRVAKAVGVRLTPSCLDDLEQQLVGEDTSGKGGSSAFIFTVADVESMAPRVKFLDVDDYAQGETLRKQARDDAVEKGRARPWESGECELQVGDCCGLLREDDEQKQEHPDDFAASASWFSGRGRILAQCDAKFTAARATFGGDVFAAGKKPGHVQRAIASIRVGRVECLCLGGAATDTAAERTRVGVGWEARARKVDAFAAIALIEGEGDEGRSAAEMKIEPTVALFKMMCNAKMADVAWEGVEAHVLRSMARSKRAIQELLGKLLEVDFYSNHVRRKVIEVFSTFFTGGELQALPEKVISLLIEAEWVSLKEGDHVLVNRSKIGDTSAVIERDVGDGTYAVKYNGGGVNKNCPETQIRDFTGEQGRDFRGRGKGTRADYLREAAVQQSQGLFGQKNASCFKNVLSFCKKRMGPSRVNTLVTITADVAVKWMQDAIKYGDPDSLKFPCRNAGPNGVNVRGETQDTPILNIVANSENENCVDLVKIVLASGANIDAQTTQGKTSLRLAIEAGHEPLINCLIQNSADVNLADRDGKTPLAAAAENHHTAAVELLIHTGAANVNQAMHDGKTPLHIAVKNGHMDIINLLITKNHANIDLAANNGQTPLYMAADAAALAEAEQAAEKVAAVVAEAAVEASVGAAAAAAVAEEEMAETASPLMELDVVEEKEQASKKNTKTQTKKGKNKTTQPSMRCGLQKKFIAIATRLVEKKADVNRAADDGKTPLMCAIKSGETQFVALLLENGADVNQTEIHGRTALFLAAKAGTTSMVRLLIDDGDAEVNKADTDGWTPLAIATFEGHIDVAEMLVKQDKSERFGKVFNTDSLSVVSLLGTGNFSEVRLP